MNIKDKSINMDEAITISNYQELLFKRRENGLLLNDYQINVLNNNGIDYKKYGNLHDLLYDIDYILQDNYQEELDIVASQIGEILYYSETKKWDNEEKQNILLHNTHFLYFFFYYLTIFTWIGTWSVFYFCNFVYCS